MNILVLSTILLVLMTIVGGIRGIKSFLILIYNAIIIFLSIFLMAHGFNAYLIMFISSVLFCLLTIFYQNGISIKTISSLISVGIILIIISFVIYYIGIRAHISGMNELQIEEGNNFMGYAVSVNMLDILIVSLVWGELGAIIDTSISISSSINEIYNNNKALSKVNLMKSGMSVGKDILGTTINTLTFVGFGESLMLFIFYTANSYTLLEIINLKSFYQEICAIITSCIGCVIIIPITAITYTMILTSSKEYKAAQLNT